MTLSTAATAAKSKKTVRKHMKRLYKALQEANDLAWSTVGAPGPVFSNTTPGPDKDSAWAEHNERMASYLVDAADMCREAVAAAPEWLRQDLTRMGKVFDKVFAKGGVCTAGPGIPCLPDLLP